MEPYFTQFFKNLWWTFLKKERKETLKNLRKSRKLKYSLRMEETFICCSVTKLCPTLVTPWTEAQQASLSFTIPWSLLKLMSTESVMLSNFSTSATSSENYERTENIFEYFTFFKFCVGKDSINKTNTIGKK